MTETTDGRTLGRAKAQQAARSFFETLAAAAVVPAVISLQAANLLLGRERACIAISERSSLWTGLFGIYKRRALLPWLIASTGREVSIGIGTILTKPTIEIGSRVYVGRYCILGDVRIGDQTLISDYVRIVSGQHGLEPSRPISDQTETYHTLCIGQDVWVGSGATILAEISSHAVVGAGSVVTKPVAEYAIVAGNPARLIGDRRQRAPKDA